jgi:cation transport ATPase
VATVWWVVQPEHVVSVLIALLVMSCPCAMSLAAPVSLAATHATLAAHPQITPEQTTILFARTRRITFQNLYGALAWHLLTMPLAALGLVTPWVAALAMFISSIAVMINAWRLYRIPGETITVAHKQDYSSTAGLV